MKNYTDSGTIRKRIDALNKKLDEKEESATKESEGLPFWSGKKIVSVKQWRSIANGGGYEEVIKYIPNGFIDQPLLELTTKKGAGRRYKDEQYNKWMNDYYDYLHYSRNPQLGERYCQKCLLEDDKEQQIHSALGLRKVLRELIQQVLSSKNKEIASSSLSSSNNSKTISPNDNRIQNEEQRAQAVSAANKQERKRDTKVIRKQLPLITIDYPCSVHNRFKCPYQESSEANDDALVSIGTYLEVIYNALLYAHTLTYQIRDYTYKADLTTKDGKIETISKYGCGLFRDSSKRLGVELESLKQPKVPIESIHDIYKALTDREKLDIILKQYLEHRMRDSQDYRDGLYLDHDKRKEMNNLRRSIVDWFIQIKDHIRIEDLTNFNGITFQEEEKNIQRRSPDQSAALTIDHSNDICCICNKRWACILCVNCNKWICLDHWFDHYRNYEIDVYLHVDSDMYKFEKTSNHKHHNKTDSFGVNSIKEQNGSRTGQSYLSKKLGHCV
jgi:hypothetical protein